MMPDSRVDGQLDAMSYGDDGVWDLVLGLVFLSLAAAEHFALDAIVAAAVFLAFPTILILKNRIVRPRLRHFDIDQRGTQASTATLMIIFAVLLFLALSALLVYTIFGGAGLPDWVMDAVPFALAAAALAALSSAAFIFSGAWRFVLYGLVVGTGFLSLYWGVIPVWAVFGVPGLLMAGNGLVLLASFLHSHRFVWTQERIRFS